MLYTLIYYGGPSDGLSAFSPRPYEATECDGYVYKAKEPAPDCLEWASDDERIIRLHYVGRGKLADYVPGLT